MVTVEPLRPTDALLDSGTIDGDHPDPVTLTEPEHDAQGRLRWGSSPRPTDSPSDQRTVVRR